MSRLSLLAIVCDRYYSRHKKGERYIITYRGKPVALMLSFPAEEAEKLFLWAYEEDWQDIEMTLQESLGRVCIMRRSNQCKQETKMIFIVPELSFYQVLSITTCSI